MGTMFASSDRGLSAAHSYSDCVATNVSAKTGRGSGIWLANGNFQPGCGRTICPNCQISGLADFELSEYYSLPLDSEYFDCDSGDRALFLFSLLLDSIHYHILVKQVTLRTIGWILLHSLL